MNVSGLFLERIIFVMNCIFMGNIINIIFPLLFICFKLRNHVRGNYGTINLYV